MYGNYFHCSLKVMLNSLWNSWFTLKKSATSSFLSFWFGLGYRKRSRRRESNRCGIYELHSLISPTGQNSPLVGAQTVAPLVAKCNPYMPQRLDSLRSDLFLYPSTNQVFTSLLGGSFFSMNHSKKWGLNNHINFIQCL